MIIMGNLEFKKYHLQYFRSHLSKTRNKKGTNLGGTSPHTPGSNPVNEEKSEKIATYLVGDIQG